VRAIAWEDSFAQEQALGKVVGATVIHADGRHEPIDDWSAALSAGSDNLIELHYDYSSHLLPHRALSSDGMWRYRALLPLEDDPIRYPPAVGGTPLLSSPRLRVASGISNLWFKDETRSPTGSNKDRATALVIESALRSGAKTVTAASTGNVAVSLSMGAAAAGLDAVIFVPATVNEGKLRLMLLAGATVFAVEEGYEAAFALSRECSKSFGWFDRNTGVNPLTVEAKKTVAFEIWEQLGREAPDAVVIPVGDGPTLTGMFKGFRELQMCGAIDRLPRMIGVQSQAFQPLKHAWDGSIATDAPRQSIADGIAVESPAGGVTALRDVRESGGGFVAVSDNSILDAIQTLASGGVIAEPAAAAGYAGLAEALAAGLIGRGEQLVVLVTGSGLKTPQYLAPEKEAIRIRASVDEVRRASAILLD
jgi:threonine synthase